MTEESYSGILADTHRVALFLTPVLSGNAVTTPSGPSVRGRSGTDRPLRNQPSIMIGTPYDSRRIDTQTSRGGEGAL